MSRGGRRFEHDPRIGVQRSEVVEKDLLGEQVWVLKVDRLDSQQGKVALVLLWWADLSGDRRPRAQAKPPNLARRDVDIIGAREVVIVGAPQKAEPVGQDLECPFAEHQPVQLNPLLEKL